MKRRHNLYLDPDLADALGALGKRPGTSQSRLVNDALRAFLSRESELTGIGLVRGRIDRVARDQALLHRDLQVLLVSFELFVRYQLMVTAPLPEADQAGRAAGRERFEAFKTQVGRELARGTYAVAPSDGASAS